MADDATPWQRHKINPPSKDPRADRDNDSSLDAVRFLFEDFTPRCWWFWTFNITMRLLETSVLVFFGRRHQRVAFAVVMVIISINIHRELQPYLSASTNLLAYLAQWTLFLWCARIMSKRGASA